jgi:hypothetical protein
LAERADRRGLASSPPCQMDIILPLARGKIWHACWGDGHSPAQRGGGSAPSPHPSKTAAAMMGERTGGASTWGGGNSAPPS